MNAPGEIDLLWLEDPPAADVARVGGKAANLSRLAAGHRIPPGFCLTAGSPDGHLTPDGTINGALRSQIEVAYATLADRTGTSLPAVAVRSSGVDEDGAAASFAGQFESYLNVAGVDAICAAIVQCWRSGENERVRAYRAGHGLSAGAGVAVLVQVLIPADSAAIAFSVNPVTGNQDELVIDAAFGLGESLVGGTVTPDSYRVRKRDLAIIGAQVGCKERMTVRLPQGTREVPVPRLLQRQPALREEQVGEIARLAIACEAAFGHAVDIECALAGETLYLLQCRPITTLSGPAPGR